MPIIIILGILLVWFVIWLKGALTPPCRAFTPDEIRRMNSEMEKLAFCKAKSFLNFALCTLHFALENAKRFHK